jgi:Tol biopolymer transport system component
MIVGGGQLNRPRIGHFYGNGSYDSLTSYFSEAYIDNTQARVEIGNGPTWRESNHREIQIPSAWSNNSITITVNQGSFTSGQKVYLYVVDGNGNVSSGLPVTIGGDAPKPPTNLRVVP